MCTTHLCLGTIAEGLRDLRRPLKFKNVKFLLSTSVSFESAIITCEIERGTGERSAGMDRAIGHEQRPFEGRGCLTSPIVAALRLSALLGAIWFLTAANNSNR